MPRITINGRDYPVRMVMGALLLFRHETGKDASQLDTESLEEMLRLMWCCAKCASQAEGTAFDMDFETFCNSITPQDVAAWNADMAAADEGKKKAAPTAEQPT